MSSLACFNKGYTFLLICIDVFSKFAWAVSLKNKVGESLVNGFQSILDHSRSPEKLKTDRGTEFLNRNFQSLLEENSIHFFIRNSELKASMVEHFNHTLKTRMWKYFTAKNAQPVCRISCKGIIIFIIEALSCALASVSLLNVGQVRRRLYEKSWTKHRRNFRLELGIKCV